MPESPKKLKVVVKGKEQQSPKGRDYKYVILISNTSYVAHV